MRSAALVAAALVVSAAVACVPPPAPPSVPPTTTPSTTVPPTTVPPTGPAVLAENPVRGVPLGGTKSVRFTWNGQTPNRLVYVDICARSTTEPGFEPGTDCAPLSSLNPTATASGSGSVDVEIFRGREPSGDLDWGCFAAGDTAPAGVRKLTTCFVRVTNDWLYNSASAREVAFTLT